MRRIICVGMVLVTTAALAQDRPRRPRPKRVTARSQGSTFLPIDPEAAKYRDDAFARVRSINDQVKRMGPWRNQSKVIIDATNRIFARNGWNNETDQFAKQISLEVTRIPPWDPTTRFNKFIGMFVKRYTLNKPQETYLRAQIMRESFGFFMAHAAEIIEQSEEMVKTRRRKQPFTADQVARWAEIGAPLMEDWQNRLSDISERMLPRLTETQRDAIGRDLRNWDQRTQEIGKLMERWQQGEWTSADWGIENDPIQNPKRAAGGPLATPGGTPPPTIGERPTPPDRGAKRDPKVFKIAQNESQWERYVRDFIAKYDLDEAQQTTALSVLAQLQDIASQLRKGRAEELAQLDQLIKKAADQNARKIYTQQREDVLAPIRGLFGELKTRLDGLLTDAQRRAGGGEAARPKAAPGAPRKAGRRRGS